MKKVIATFLATASVLAGCILRPEATEVEVTRIIEVLATVEVEVTRQVEVTRLVEVETTLVVEVPRDVEVTRIVEQVVTATPVPTTSPTAAPSLTSTPMALETEEPPPLATGNLLQTMIRTRDNMLAFGGMIDAAVSSGSIACRDVVDLYDSIVAAPTFNMTGGTATAQNAYNSYRSAISVFTLGARDMAQNCRDFLVTQDPGTIPFQQWGQARQEVNEATDILHPAIQSLGG